jgi:hypothetical protein
MAITKFTNTNKLPASKLLRAERRLDLTLHFEAAFERILKDPECAHCSTAEVAAKLAQEAVTWIEGYDDMVDGAARAKASKAA